MFFFFSLKIVFNVVFLFVCLLFFLAGWSDVAFSVVAACCDCAEVRDDVFVLVWPTPIGFGTRERVLQIDIVSATLDLMLLILAMMLLRVMGGVEVVVSNVGSLSLARVVPGAVSSQIIC